MCEKSRTAVYEKNYVLKENATVQQKWLVSVLNRNCCNMKGLAEKREAELAEKIRKLNEQVKKEEEAVIAAEEQIANNPDNQLTEGGYVAPDRNNLYEADCPNILANSVPLTSMGQFGQDIIDRYKEEWPNWEEVGMFNPETAVADVYLDFGHEKWLEAQRAKEAESQEKQAS